MIFCTFSFVYILKEIPNTRKAFRAAVNMLKNLKDRTYALTNLFQLRKKENSILEKIEANSPAKIYLLTWLGHLQILDTMKSKQTIKNRY